MCGIAGFLAPRNRRNDLDFDEVAGQMARALRHRGPDDSGTWCDHADGIAMGHSRLSIIDTSAAGRQPMVAANGQFVVGLNGEIYNYRDLRKELSIKGYPFMGQSDTEVAVASIQEFGVAEALERFVGMFALSIWDKAKHCLYLARDRIGEKPLYYGNYAGYFVFGSELGAIRAFPHCAPVVDRESLSMLVRYAYVAAPRSIFKGVNQVMPGRLLSVSVGDNDLFYEERAFWAASDMLASVGGAPGDLDPVSSLERLLRETVAEKMIADVPLGAFLSGGIDSSAIVAMMQAESAGRTRTFSIGFREQDYNEAHYAKRVAEHLGTEHTELYVSPDQAQAIIPEIPQIYCEPFADSSQIPTFLLCKLAREHVTVALSGDGADELFGGYTRYALGHDIWRKTQKVPRVLRSLLRNTIARIPPRSLDALYHRARGLLPANMRFRQIGHKMHKLGEILGDGSESSVYQHLISLWMKPSEIVIGGRDVDVLDPIASTLDSISDFRQRMMYADLLTYLPNDILVKVDRASMANSMEVRAPYLDHRVVEFAWALPPDFKLRNGQSKWILRRLLHRYVPPELVERPKMGFGVPIDEWLRGPLRSWADGLLEEDRLREEGIFFAAPILEKWRQHLSGEGAWHYLLWPVLMYQAWAEYHTAEIERI